MFWILLILYQIKHFICDGPLQGRYMLGKFKPFPACLPALSAHSAVHGVGTFLIAYAVGSKSAFWLALLDFFVHGVVDYLKANPALGGRWSAISKNEYKAMFDGGVPYGFTTSVRQMEPIEESLVEEKMKSNTYFWWALQVDQAAHHLTHYFIIWCLV